MTTKKTILQTIRKHCLECVCGSPKEVELCTSEDCALYPYRSGKDPMPNSGKSKIMAGNNPAQFSNNSTPRREKISLESTNAVKVVPEYGSAFFEAFLA
ncbi:hypothetical protein [Methanolobus halotolerans]|uniref:Uncharacterized protein n=1 Tax=Methanolobus halotolerans TaxID=2052935 RepID=A0A4E0PZ35_9EURY|nr:hypothetical protein [Methanolobus halotolerans]TGC11578.1 hypothetical protein CUN85_01555 [Methanolobus halotolerans]